MSYEKELFRLEQPHGPGEIQFAWQKGSGAYVATTGADCCISIYNRHGRFVQKMRLPGLCLSLDWDSDGDLLGAICTNSSVVSLWDANTGKKCTIETGLIRDTLSCLLWAKNAPILAITTTKGNIVIYNHNTAKRIPILGKHTKSITSGGWSSEGLLALGSDDRTLSISNVDGDSLRVIQLRAEPNQIQFSEMKTDERAAKENTVSVVVGKKTLFLYNLQDPENPIELAFQPRYGNIVIYKWFGDGYILIGFSAGYFVAISTHIREVGQELFQAKNHRDTFSDIAISHLLGKVASCGDNTVKVHEMGQLSESPAVISVDDESGGVERIAYSEDGQLLGVGTASGSLRVYLTRLPMLAAAYNNTIALLTALTQLTIHQLQLSLHKGKMSPCSVSLEMEVEPSFLALGPYHMVGGMNNRAWLYELNRTFPSPSPDDNIMSGDYSPTNAALIVPQFVSDREYLGSVQSIRLNAEYTSALFEGKLLLHLTECSGGASANNEERESKLFPEEGEHLSITCHALTSDFLVYASDMGHLRYFYLEDWVQVTDYRHSVGIKEIFSDHVGTRLIVFDDKSEGYLYNPVSDTMLVIPGFPSTATGAIWDLYHPERNVFIVFDSQIIVTYLHIRDSIDGPSVSKVGETKLPLDQKPLVLHAGEVTLETSGGKLVTLLLSTHQMPTPTTNLNQTQCFQMALDKRIALHRFQEAWNTCVSLDQKESWDKLIDCALHNLQIDTSIRLYRQIGEAGMVWSLQRIQDIEDKKLLSGHVCMFLQDFDKAQELFLESSEPVQALVMRQDIMQWDQALQLARSLDPSRIPYLSREYANQLELIGQYTEALAHYERGLSEEVIREDDHNTLCRAGIARTAIRCGDYRRGIAMATDPRADVQLKQECAEILESMKKLNEAAILFEKAENFDRAASAYISLKNWQKVGELLPKVTSTKIHQQYAKVKESMGEYRVARQAYQLAGDLDSVVRLDLEHLNDPQEAVRIVQQTRSIDGAKSVAKFFQRIGDYSSAIRFLVMSRCHSDAFRLSRDHNQLELYGDILVEESIDGEAEQEFLSLAVHFEQSQGKYFLAGKYYYHARDYKKAMKYLLMAARSNRDEEDNEEANAIGLAIEVVGASNDDVLANQLIELLLGETDGEPRDPKYVFRLYMARRQYREAAKTAIIIAKEEQINGNYRSAHDVLLGMCQELRENHLRIGTEMMDNLTLLHSYILVRLHVRLGNHLNAARMLIRVADNISKFPSHIVPILTSAVIECHRADLKATAFTYAAMLMRPEYRSQVEPKYRKKMEGVVRKPPRGANNKLLPDEPEPLTPCPYCGYRLPETQLHCTQCKSNVPFCIATGRHILKDDLTVCTNCHFPAIKTELLLLLESGDNNCPMCCERLDPHQLKSIHDLSIYLQPSSSDDQ